MRLTRLVAAVVLLSLAVPSARAATVSDREPVVDLATTPVDRGSSPEGFFVHDGIAYFAAEDDAHGREPWRSDGTAEGTYLLGDLCPGRCGSEPSFAAAAGGRVLFAARERDRFRLWATDGTVAGTEVLTPPSPVEPPGALFAGASLGEVAVLVLADREHGIEPWTSDGTSAGTALLADLCPGECSSLPRSPTRVGERVLFTANEPSLRDLWSTDGAAVELVAAGTTGAVPQGFFAWGDRLLFQGDDGEPWASDGTAAGTGRLADALPGDRGSEAFGWRPFGDSVFFEVYDETGGTHVWRTDGTPAGTAIATELAPLEAQGPVRPLGVAGGRLLVAATGSGSLWALRPGGSLLRLSSTADPHRPYYRSLHPVEVGDRLLFPAGGQDGFSSLWASDGTPAGTARLLEVGEAGRSAAVVGGVALLGVAAGDEGLELWASDATVAGTARLADLRPPAASAEPRTIVPSRGELVFFLADGDAGAGFYRLRGDGVAQRAIPEVERGVVTPRGKAVFFGDPGPAGGLWALDGHGEALLSDLPVRELVPGGGGVFFGVATDGQAVWRSDGTPGGTSLLVDVHPDHSTECHIVCPDLFFPDHLATLGGGLLFVGAAGGVEELYWTDGASPPATTLLHQGTLTPPIVAGRRAFFYDFATGRLYRTQGAAVREVAALPGWLERGVAVGRGIAFVLAVDGRRELWWSDGSAKGTRRLATPLAEPLAIGELAASRGRLFAVLETEAHGAELWTSDGGPLALVTDLHAGARGAGPRFLTPTADGRLVFAADDGVHGHEPWLTDGTAAGTVLLADLAPGPAASSPEGFAFHGSRLFFAADDGAHGRELFALDLAGE